MTAVAISVTASTRGPSRPSARRRSHGVSSVDQLEDQQAGEQCRQEMQLEDETERQRTQAPGDDVGTCHRLAKGVFMERCDDRRAYVIGLQCTRAGACRRSQANG